MAVTTKRDKANIILGQKFEFSPLLKYRKAITNSFSILGPLLKKYRQISKDAEKILRKYLVTKPLPNKMYISSKEILKEVFPETKKAFKNLKEKREIKSILYPVLLLSKKI